MSQVPIPPNLQKSRKRGKLLRNGCLGLVALVVVCGALGSLLGDGDGDTASTSGNAATVADLQPTTAPPEAATDVVSAPTQPPAVPTSTTAATSIPGPTAASLATLNAWANNYNTYAKGNFECCMRAVVVDSNPVKVSVLLSEQLEQKSEAARKSIANGLMSNLQMEHGLCLSVVTFLHGPMSPFPDEYTNTTCE